MIDTRDSASYRAVEKLLAETMGLDPESIGKSNIAEDVRILMKGSGVNDVQLFLETLASSDTQLEKLIERVVVPETWFFRDRESFGFLSKHVRERTRTWKQALRVLSVPCSTGEEPYSIAITLLGSGLTPDRFRIDAADISGRALEAAKRAVYGKGSFREKNKTFMDDYFTPTDDGLKLHDRAAACVDFHRCNFVRPDALIDRDPYDIIFCKNLLIYLNQEARARVAANLGRLLVPGGLLFTGHAEIVSILQFGYAPVKHARSFACVKATQTDERRQAPGRKETAGRAAEATGDRKAARAACSTTAVETAPGLLGDHKKQTRPSELGAIRELADKGALDKAEGLCAQFLKLHPHDKEGYYLMGLIQLALNAFTAAEDFFQKALYLDPQHYNALVHLCLLYEKKGDRAKAALIRNRIQRVEEAEGTRQETA